MSKPATQVLGVQGFTAGGMMGEGEPAPAPADAPELDDLAKLRNRMRARLAGMSNTYIKRRGLVLTIDGGHRRAAGGAAVHDARQRGVATVKGEGRVSR